MKGSFLTNLNATPISAKDWQLDTPLFYERTDGERIIVADGFVTDFASIPDLAKIGALVQFFAATILLASTKWFVPHFICTAAWIAIAFAWCVIMVAESLSCDSRLDRGATVHDWLYRRDRSRGKKFSDDTLKEALRASDVPEWKVFIVWLNVMLFGGSSWREDGNASH